METYNTIEQNFLDKLDKLQEAEDLIIKDIDRLNIKDYLSFKIVPNRKLINDVDEILKDSEEGLKFKREYEVKYREDENHQDIRIEGDKLDTVTVKLITSPLEIEYSDDRESLEQVQKNIKSINKRLSDLKENLKQINDVYINYTKNINSNSNLKSISSKIDSKKEEIKEYFMDKYHKFYKLIMIRTFQSLGKLGDIYPKELKNHNPQSILEVIKIRYYDDLEGNERQNVISDWVEIKNYLEKHQRLEGKFKIELNKFLNKILDKEVEDTINSFLENKVEITVKNVLEELKEKHKGLEKQVFTEFYNKFFELHQSELKKPYVGTKSITLTDYQSVISDK